MNRWLEMLESWARTFTWIFGMMLAIITVVTVLDVLDEASRRLLLVSLLLFLPAATIVFVFEARRRFASRMTGPEKGAPAKKERDAERGGASGQGVPWRTYGRLEWSRFSFGVVMISLGMLTRFLLDCCVRFSVWASTLGIFMLLHLLVVDNLITRFKIPGTIRASEMRERPFTMSTTRYWMETVRTLTYWTIAGAGVVIGILAGDVAEWTLLSKLGVAALGLAIVSGFFYNIALIAAIESEEGQRLTVNRRRFTMGYFFFNLMFTSFIGGVAALIIAVMV